MDEKIEQAAGPEGAEAQRILPAEAVSMKFRDVGELWRAYRNLETAFTKKCQRLSELERAGARGGSNGEEKPSGPDSVPPARSPHGGDRGPLREGDRDSGKAAAGVADSRSTGQREGTGEPPTGELPAGPSDLIGSPGRTISAPVRAPVTLSEAGRYFLRDLGER